MKDRTKDTIDLTPNYGNIFRAMMQDLKSRQVHLIFSDCLSRQDQAKAIRAVQCWFAPLALAAGSLTNAKELNELQNAVADILLDLNETAQKLEGVEDGEPELFEVDGEEIQ